MIQPGSVVTVDFPGVKGIKRRPAVVVSSAEYHRARPDVILAIVTSQVASATSPMDYMLRDWHIASLHRPSAVRMFLVTVPRSSVVTIGSLSARDWQEVQKRLRLALSIA